MRLEVLWEILAVAHQASYRSFIGDYIPISLKITLVFPPVFSGFISKNFICRPLDKFFENLFQVFFKEFLKNSLFEMDKSDVSSFCENNANTFNKMLSIKFSI